MNQMDQTDQSLRYEILSSDGRLLLVYDYCVVLSQQGVRGALLRGAADDKVIYFQDVSTVQFKNCGWTAGFLEFSFPGSWEKPGGPISGAGNENRFTFGRPTIGAAKKLAKEMEEVNSFIQQKIREGKSI